MAEVKTELEKAIVGVKMISGINIPVDITGDEIAEFEQLGVVVDLENIITCAFKGEDGVTFRVTIDAANQTASISQSIIDVLSEEQRNALVPLVEGGRDFKVENISVDGNGDFKLVFNTADGRRLDFSVDALGIKAVLNDTGKAVTAEKWQSAARIVSVLKTDRTPSTFALPKNFMTLLHYGPKVDGKLSLVGAKRKVLNQILVGLAAADSENIAVLGRETGGVNCIYKIDGQAYVNSAATPHKINQCFFLPMREVIGDDSTITGYQVVLKFDATGKGGKGNESYSTYVSKNDLAKIANILGADALINYEKTEEGRALINNFLIEHPKSKAAGLNSYMKKMFVGKTVGDEPSAKTASVLKKATDGVKTYNEVHVLSFDEIENELNAIAKDKEPKPDDEPAPEDEMVKEEPAVEEAPVEEAPVEEEVAAEPVAEPDMIVRGEKNNELFRLVPSGDYYKVSVLDRQPGEKRSAYSERLSFCKEYRIQDGIEAQIDDNGAILSTAGDLKMSVSRVDGDEFVCSVTDEKKGKVASGLTITDWLKHDKVVVDEFAASAAPEGELGVAAMSAEDEAAPEAASAKKAAEDAKKSKKDAKKEKKKEKEAAKKSEGKAGGASGKYDPEAASTYSKLFALFIGVVGILIGCLPLLAVSYVAYTESLNAAAKKGAPAASKSAEKTDKVGDNAKEIKSFKKYIKNFSREMRACKRQLGQAQRRLDAAEKTKDDELINKARQKMIGVGKNIIETYEEMISQNPIMEATFNSLLGGEHGAVGKLKEATVELEKLASGAAVAETPAEIKKTLVESGKKLINIGENAGKVVDKVVKLNKTSAGKTKEELDADLADIAATLGVTYTAPAPAEAEKEEDGVVIEEPAEGVVIEPVEAEKEEEPELTPLPSSSSLYTVSPAKKKKDDSMEF